MSARVLVFGVGNPGRRDDGLGPALAAALAAHAVEDVTVEIAYQLQVEDAALVAEHDLVVFADADASCRPPFELRRIEPAAGVAFSTHSLAPRAVLALARQHFQAAPRAFELAIRAHDLEGYGEGLSRPGQANLRAAAEHLERLLRSGGLAAEPAGASSGG